MQSLVIALLLSRELGLAITGLGVRLGANRPRYRIPDVCVADVLAKAAEYLKAGIPCVWLPDPYKHELAVATNAGLHEIPALAAETPLVGLADCGGVYGQLDALEK